MKIAVLAAGAWGSALAIAFAKQHAVTLWSRESDLVDQARLSRENPRYLPGYRFPEGLEISADFTGSIAGSDLLIVATPIAGLRETLLACELLAPGIPLLWVCKGFEAGTGLLPHQVAAECLIKSRCYGALSGPSFAQEVAAGKPTALSCAGVDQAWVREVSAALHGQGLRVYASEDLVGVEVGGAVKNVLAIATGVCDGLDLGLNARAALMTRGLAEIARLGQALGAKRETFMGLAGMGDLILTCTGDLSRNRRVGKGLASGQPLPMILENLGHVAEGVPTALEVAKLARALQVDMPIASAVAAVLGGQQNVSAAIASLLARDPRDELA